MAITLIDTEKVGRYNDVKALLQAAKNVKSALEADLAKATAEVAALEARILTMSTGFAASIKAVDDAAKLAVEAPKEV